MKDEIISLLQQHGPKTVYQLADMMQDDVYDISTAAVELMDDGVLYLEPADGTLWYAEEA